MTGPFGTRVTWACEAPLALILPTGRTMYLWLISPRSLMDRGGPARCVRNNICSLLTVFYADEG